MCCETVGNPEGNLADLRGLAAGANRHGVPLLVDNTVATPVLLRPIKHGAGIVINSLTKFMGSQGTTPGGAIVDSSRSRWADYPERFPMFKACHPASTAHGVMPREDQRKSGIAADTIRVGVGIEHADDTIADIHQALVVAADNGHLGAGVSRFSPEFVQ